MKALVLAVCAGVALCAPLAAVAETPEATLDRIIDDYWSFELREDPLRATSAGVHDHDARLPSVTPEDEARRTAARADFLARLDALDVAAIDDGAALNAALLRFILRHDALLAPFDAARTPFLADTGFHSDLTYAFADMPFRTERDIETYVARLRAVPAYLEQNVANMRRGLADGFTQPRVILPGILPSFEAQAAADPERHPLFAAFRSGPPAGVSARRFAALKREAARVIEREVAPAYGRVFAFMRDEYAPAARETTGAGALPDGDAYYAALVRYYTTLDDATPDAVHEIGLREVARIRQEMETVIARTGFEGDFAAFLDFLRNDPRFYAETPEALLKEAAWLAKTIDGRLPGWFGKLPRQPYSVDPVPEAIAPNYTSGRYSGAPAGADKGGSYWVNTYALDKRPLYELPALTLHEAVPGHHLQGALALEIDGAPAFRRQFYPHAYGEGWALYAERLGVEMGVYRNDYEEFGRLSFEMWRACRLVIDTGLHAKGWTRDQAIDYLASNTALSLHNVRTEVDRYIAWPGQALAYKMGELTIRELREKAEAALGDDFDVRRFHDAILVDGGMPLELLRARIDRFIEEEKR